MMDGNDREREEGRAVGMMASGHIPNPHPDANKIRILWVFAQLDGGAEEAELHAMARNLDPARHHLTVLPCRDDATPPRTHDRLRALGVEVDTAALELSFEDTVDHLRRRMTRADIVLSSQDAPDVYPALQSLALRPPLIERGSLIGHALSGPKDLTTRHVGTSDTIRAAAAGRMRPDHAVHIPLMIDPAAADPAIRASLGVAPDAVLIGWVGGPAGAKDLVAVARDVAKTHPHARFAIMDASDGTMPESARNLRRMAGGPNILDPGDQPGLMMAVDVMCCLSGGSGIPPMIARARAAGLPVVTDMSDPMHDDDSGLLVPPGDQAALADALRRLIDDPARRRTPGAAPRTHAHRTAPVDRILAQWERLFAEVLAERHPAPPPGIFDSFILGGWESSTHRLRGGTRLDVIASTGHDVHAADDYRQLRDLGIRACRDAVRWHLMEPSPGRYDLASFTPMLTAARDSGMQVIWDLMHYGWPDDLDIWSPAFVHRFTDFARAVGEHHRAVTDTVPFWCPVNEISFFSWAGGDGDYLNPFAKGRGFEMKVQLARAAISAMKALRAIDPRARFLHAEPLIGIHYLDKTGRPRWDANGWHDAQFQAMDMISGRIWPQLGGDPSLLDIVGVNYYFNNQWINGGPPIDVDHPSYAPLSDLLTEIAARYDRPVLIAETGIEGDRRAPWFRYVAEEVRKARRRGVPVEGICLYPIANHLGWDNDRLCENGLLGHEVVNGARTVHAPLASAIRSLTP